MALFSRSSSAPPSTPSESFGVHCSTCDLPPAATTPAKAEADGWKATHDNLHHRGASTAEVR